MGKLDCDHEVDGCGGALRIGGIDYKLTVHTADAHSANGGAEWNVRKSQSASCGIDAYHVRVVLLVRGNDQGNYLSLIAETVRKQRTDGAVDLAAGQDFFFAGTAFALDESARNASARVGVFAVVHGEGEEVNAFPGIGRRHRGCENNGFSSGDQRCAGCLLSHAAGLKDQPLAAGKLDGYFMLGRHSVLVSFFRLGNLYGECARRVKI